jgi:hypothetical protein
MNSRSIAKLVLIFPHSGYLLRFVGSLQQGKAHIANPDNLGLYMQEIELFRQLGSIYDTDGPGVNNE